MIWSDGTVGEIIAISEIGFYWTQYSKEGCRFSTDTIFVELEEGEFDIGTDLSKQLLLW